VARQHSGEQGNKPGGVAPLIHGVAAIFLVSASLLTNELPVIRSGRG
jgi:hypothetical protein